MTLARDQVRILDSDGHLIEHNAEIASFIDESVRRVARGEVPAQDGPFPTLDGIHNYFKGQGGRFSSGPRQTASEERTGSGEDWREFLNKTGVEQSILFPTKGLAVGFIQTPEYASFLCRAYNDWCSERYKSVDQRLHPIALIPMQNPTEAVVELRRVVKDLGFLGTMLPSTGLPLHLGHEYYWPIYEEAEKLGAVLAIHGGSNRTIGLDTFTDFVGSHVLHHPVPLMYALTSFVYHGVFDRYPDLKIAFLEGGPGWLVCLLDRAIRDDEFFGRVAQKGFDKYLTGGNVLIGCEGNDASLAYVASRIGIEPFAYSSDYPHEVDLAGALHEIDETLEADTLTPEQKHAVLFENTKRFYGL